MLSRYGNQFINAATRYILKIKIWSNNQISFHADLVPNLSTYNKNTWICLYIFWLSLTKNLKQLSTVLFHNFISLHCFNYYSGLISGAHSTPKCKIWRPECPAVGRDWVRWDPQVFSSRWYSEETSDPQVADKTRQVPGFRLVQTRFTKNRW